MNINYLAVLVSAIASMIIGSIWYGPLFGKMFIHEQGWDTKSKEERDAMMKGMTMTYVWQFVTSIVTFAVLNIFINAMAVGAGFGGIHVALLVWFGFLVTFKLGDSLWSGKMKLFWLSAGCSLVTFVVAGAIIGYWR